MRQKRRNRNTKNLGKWRNVIIFFIIAPIVAILITIGLFRYLILPYIVSDDNPDNINQDKQNNEDDSGQGDDNNNDQDSDITDPIITLRLDGMSLFNVQLGSFSSKENAQSLVNQLKEKDINAYVVDSDSFKVFAGTFFSRTEAERYKDKLKNTYKDAFLKEFYIGGAVIEYLAVDQEYEDEIVDLIKTMENSYSQEAGLWTVAINNYDIKELKEKTISNNTVIDTKLKSIKDKVNSKSLENLISSLESQHIARQQLVNRLSDNNTKSIIDSYEQFNNILFNYMKTITQNQ